MSKEQSKALSKLLNCTKISANVVTTVVVAVAAVVVGIVVVVANVDVVLRFLSSSIFSFIS